MNRRTNRLLTFNFTNPSHLSQLTHLKGDIYHEPFMFQTQPDISHRDYRSFYLGHRHTASLKKPQALYPVALLALMENRLPGY